MSMRTASYRDSAKEAQRQAIAQGGLTIKLMTVGLVAITAAHSYWMWSQKKFPWQNGVQISDLKVLLPGAKIREAEALQQQRAKEAALKAVAAHKAAASAAASPVAAAEAAR